MYKNQLQELAQRSCFNLPSYTCIREGPDHAPRFKAAVNFNGEVFESPSFCTTLRQAEHSAAEVALSSLSCRGPSHSLAARILDETGVYKNLLQEISQRVGAPLPSYTTFRSGLGHLPVFTCTVELAGITFTGEPAKNKKQAEKNAAMAAWSSLKQLARQAARSSTEPENNDEQEQITIARALLNYRLKEKMAMANNPNASPFPKKFPIPPERKLSSSLQHPQQAGSKILPLIRQSTQRSRPSSPSSAEGSSSQPFMSQKFPAAGAAPYVPVCRSHYGAHYHGMAPPVTIRTAVPVFSAPPLPPPSRHHQLPPVMGPAPIRMASPVRIRQAVPVFAAPTQSAAAISMPVVPPVQVKESPSPPIMVGTLIPPPAKMEEKLESEAVFRPVTSAARKEETFESEVKDLEESAAIERLKKLQI
ncbi:double-stranded RNA-binding protein 6 isoform X2 [Iris pallida]|uniref:Double-stranded RNA-binding protein 6 isoform X2 n=1 Tax=Iris pallida TaxID=29817 RepID=A0AAX6GKI9_IRIPA|nr:double-stranded RNA-binding protein 6 isoform X2 [Iris pallida]